MEPPPTQAPDSVSVPEIYNVWIVSAFAAPTVIANAATHATHLLSSGIHPKIASERLGHSKVGITLDLYSHVMPGMQEDAVAKVDAALRAVQKPA
jgi:integrase